MIAETLELEATDGTATIAKAEDVFTWGIDGDFRKWGLDVKAKPTKATKVQVREMIKNGTFAQVFNGLSDNLDSLCLTQSQIIQFVVKHKKWLRTDGYGTFFLFKVGKEFFVARVSLDSGERPYVNASRFSGDYVWGADYPHRFVVPQLALGDFENSPSDALSSLTLESAMKIVKENGYVVYKIM